MNALEKAARKAYALRQRERRFLQGFTDHGLTCAQVQALRDRLARAREGIGQRIKRLGGI
jgi:hypothetical protein